MCCFGLDVSQKYENGLSERDNRGKSMATFAFVIDDKTSVSVPINQVFGNKMKLQVGSEKFRIFETIQYLHLGPKLSYFKFT